VKPEPDLTVNSEPAPENRNVRLTRENWILQVIPELIHQRHKVHKVQTRAYAPALAPVWRKPRVERRRDMNPWRSSIHCLNVLYSNLHSPSTWVEYPCFRTRYINLTKSSDIVEDGTEMNPPHQLRTHLLLVLV
jgi:hypothetical protein